MVAITRVPDASDGILGILDLQGEVIPVLDIRLRLGLSRQRLHADNRLFVVRAGERRLAFAVDEAREVLTVAAGLVESPSNAVARARLLAAVIRRAEGLVLVLDEMRLLPPEAAGDEPSEPDRGSPRESLAASGERPLTRIRGVGRGYAAKLAGAGLQTLDDLAAADAEELALLLSLPPARLPEVEGWIEQARVLARRSGGSPPGSPSGDPNEQGRPER